MPTELMNIAGASGGNNVQLTNAIFDVYSKEILMEAQPYLRFLSVCNIQRELGVMPGKTINFLRFNALTGTNVLTEGVQMDSDVLSNSVISISVGERGKALKFSEFLLKSSPLQLLRHAAVMLGQHYAKLLDAEIRDAYMSGTNIKYSQKGGAAASRADLVAGSKLDVSLIRDCVEFLATKKAPKFGGDAYIGFVHPHQTRGLKDDPNWVNIQDYANPQNLLKGEIGRIEDVRFIETTNLQYIPKGTQDIYADGADTGSNTAIAANAATDVYRALICGDYSCGYAESLPVEMRDGGVLDLGREHKIGYYGIWGAGRIEDAHSVIAETA